MDKSSEDVQEEAPQWLTDFLFDEVSAGLERNHNNLYAALIDAMGKAVKHPCLIVSKRAVPETLESVELRPYLGRADAYEDIPIPSGLLDRAIIPLRECLVADDHCDLTVESWAREILQIVLHDYIYPLRKQVIHQRGCANNCSPKTPASP